MKKFALAMMVVPYSACFVAAQSESIQLGTANAPVKEMEPTLKDFISSLGLDSGIRKIETGEVTERQVAMIALVLRNTREVEMHRMRGASKNSTYLSRDGHREAVFDGKGLPVTDDINGPSYNYFSVNDWPLSHFLFDTFPWLLFGNSPKDPTSQKERIQAFRQDFEFGLAAAVLDGKLGAISGKEQLASPGSKEVVAMILYCLEEKEAANFFSLFESNKSLDKQKVQSIMRRLDASLTVLVSKAVSKIKIPTPDSNRK